MTNFETNNQANTEIKCPNCGHAIVLSQQNFDSIAQQVRDSEFEKEVNERTRTAVRLAEVSKDKQIVELSRKLDAAQHDKAIAVRDAVDRGNGQLRDKEQEIVRLKAELTAQSQRLSAEKDASLKLAEAEKDKVIVGLRAQLQAARQDKATSVQVAVAAKDKQIAALTAENEKQKLDFSLREEKLHSERDNLLRYKDEQIAMLKDMKAKLSTKMLGESLEQYCWNEFEKLRALAFPNAYFEKDNDASNGSKGDFIFRAFDANGTEYVSIMFEMKNESDESVYKHKNTDFLKKLDADRNAKDCEFAVLVSTLEPDNELYSGGIVSVSHLYKKTFIVRPQCFIAILMILCYAAQNAHQYREEADLLRNQHFDVQEFANKLFEFKDKYGKGFENASKQFETAIAEIDRSIDRLEKTKKALLASLKHLTSTNKKVEDLSLKKLTRGNPTMQQKFKDAGIDVSGGGG